LHLDPVIVRGGIIKLDLIWCSYVQPPYHVTGVLHFQHSRDQFDRFDRFGRILSREQLHGGNWLFSNHCLRFLQFLQQRIQLRRIQFILRRAGISEHN
jgi:hypothetical protein